jgi:beta-glucanase (GH16 family)
MKRSCSRGLVPALCLIFAAASAVSAAAEDAAPQTLAGRDFLTVPGGEWKLLWNDEFNGQQLDKARWSIGLPWGGTDGSGRHHNENYASYIMDDDINVRDGVLHLTTQRRDVKDRKGKVYNFTQGLITTSGKFRVTHGYFEILAKMPTEAGPGTWQDGRLPHSRTSRYVP